MAIRWYVLPIEEILIDGTNFRGPKYLAWRQNPSGLDVQWSMMDYGLMPVAIVAINAEQADHDTLAGFADVTQVPENLDGQLAAASATVSSRLEDDYLIPSDWVNGSLTYRETLRTVAGMFQYSQRYHGLTGEAILTTDQPNTQWRNVDAGRQAAHLEALESFGIDTGFIRNNTQMRAIMKAAADIWDGQTFRFGFTTL